MFKLDWYYNNQPFIMKKTNKTYHFQEPSTNQVNSSPGKIIKNYPKNPHDKSSTKHNASITHKKHEFLEINKKVE